MVDTVTVPVALVEELTGDAFKSLLNYKIPVILQLSWVDVEPHTAKKARATRLRRTGRQLVRRER